jgi:hypothetical protein
VIQSDAIGKQISTGVFERSAKRLAKRDEKVRRLLRRLRDECPWIQGGDVVIARRFCELEVIISQIFGAMSKMLRAEENGLLYRDKNGDLVPRGLIEAHRKLAQTQAAIADRLGLTPAARMQIGAAGRNGALDIVAELASETVDRAIQIGEERQGEREQTDDAKDDGEGS